MERRTSTYASYKFRPVKARLGWLTRGCTFWTDPEDGDTIIFWSLDSSPNDTALSTQVMWIFSDSVVSASNLAHDVWVLWSSGLYFPCRIDFVCLFILHTYIGLPNAVGSQSRIWYTAYCQKLISFALFWWLASCDSEISCTMFSYQTSILSLSFHSEYPKNVSW